MTASGEIDAATAGFVADAVSAARERLFTGYGSCSFSEPVEDLRGLRIL